MQITVIIWSCMHHARSHYIAFLNNNFDQYKFVSCTNCRILCSRNYSISHCSFKFLKKTFFEANGILNEFNRVKCKIHHDTLSKNIHQMSPVSSTTFTLSKHINNTFFGWNFHHYTVGTRVCTHNRVCGSSRIFLLTSVVFSSSFHLYRLVLWMLLSDKHT